MTAVFPLLIFFFSPFLQAVPGFNQALLKAFDLGDESNQDFSSNRSCSLEAPDNACNPFDQLRMFQNWSLGNKDSLIRKRH